MTADVVCQQGRNLAADGFGIPKGNQNAVPVAQQFLGVPVRRRYDRLSQSKAVGERARRHLGFVEIGRYIDVAHRNEIQKRGLLDKLVEEDDMILDAELAHAGRQAIAIGFALLTHKVRVGRAENDIDSVGARFDDPRHGIEHGLDALVRRQKPERKNDGLSGKAEFRLGIMRFTKRQVRDTVRYDLDFVGRHIMH